MMQICTLNSGSVVLSTVLDNNPGSKALSENCQCHNGPWHYMRYSVRKKNITSRADLIINSIKTTLIHITKVKLSSEITECLIRRKMIKLLSSCSGFTPYKTDIVQLNQRVKYKH